MYVCHAEMNAILNKNSEKITDCSIYVALFPCNECAKMIIQSVIKSVIYLSDKHKDKSNTIASKVSLTLMSIETLFLFLETARHGGDQIHSVCAENEED